MPLPPNGPERDNYLFYSLPITPRVLFYLFYLLPFRAGQVRDDYLFYSLPVSAGFYFIYSLLRPRTGTAIIIYFIPVSLITNNYFNYFIYFLNIFRHWNYRDNCNMPPPWPKRCNYSGGATIRVVKLFRGELREPLRILVPNKA